jgi:APA family basic amino acid/polyamine antiporter
MMDDNAAAGSDSPDTVADPHTLPRVLGRFDAITVVVGSIIGSGIFLKESQVAAGLQSFGLCLTVWVVIGLVTLCGSLALAELAAMLPHAGGPYVYLREAYGRLPAFLWGWTEFWIIRTGSLGALACATVIYFSVLVPLDHAMQAAMSIAIVVGLSAINVIGTRWGANVQNLTTVIKVGFLAGLICLPVLLGKNDTANLGPIWPQTVDASLWRAIGVAMIAVFWPYDGWINIAPVAEEIQDPQRNVPIALTLGVLTVMVAYVGAVISYHLVLPYDQVAGSTALVSDVCEKLFGSWGAKLAAIGVMCSTFGAVNSNMLTGPRIYFAMARDGLLPDAVRHVHPRFQTPANAIIMQCVWTVILTFGAFAWKSGPNGRPIDAFDALTDFVIFGGSIFYALAVGAVFVLRFRMPNEPRPYRTWGYPITPAVYLAAFVAALVSMFVKDPVQSLTGLLLIASGAVYYAWASRRSSRI